MMMAYIDPASGSILLQLIIGAVVGGGLFLRRGLTRAWSRLTGGLRRS